VTPEWSEALRIMGVGFGVVFAVMGLIAVLTWLSGKVFIGLDARDKARDAAAKAAAEAEAKAKAEAEAKAGSEGGDA